jgi:replicative DNA helicase
MNDLYSLQIERHVLGGLIRNQDVFAEIDAFVSEKDFFNDVHYTIFSVIKNCAYNQKKIDKVLLANQIKELGVSFKDDINIYDYIENLSFTQITKPATLEACKELVKYRVRREISATAEKIKDEVKRSGEKNVDDIVSACDAIYNDKIQEYSDEDKPEKLTDNLMGLLEETGNDPRDEFGFASPYPEFNRLYGGFRAGHVYAIASRPGEGKSTWLNDVLFKVAENDGVKTLMFDTEMLTKEIQFRLLSSLTSVPTWHLETGNWRKNPDYYEQVRAAEERIKENKDYYHLHVGNLNIDQLCSKARRWYYNEVGRGNKCMFAYDYVKLTGEKVGQNWAEYQAIGDKIQRLKELAVELNAPLLTAMQLNRSGENRNRNSASLVDDSTAISLSDRLQWFAAFVAIFRRKTLDEIALDGEERGTHKLIPTKTRFQGKDAMGHQDFLPRMFPDGSVRYQMNYINFDIRNFNIEERGSLRHICERARETYDLEGGSSEDPTNAVL